MDGEPPQISATERYSQNQRVIVYNEGLFSNDGGIAWHNPPEKRRYFNTVVEQHQTAFSSLRPDTTSLLVIPAHREPEITTLRTFPKDSTVGCIINVNDRKGASANAVALNTRLISNLETTKGNNTVILDTTDREDAMFGDAYFSSNSIGFARALAIEGGIKKLQEIQGDRALEIPIIWSDSDSYAEEGYYSRLEAFYREHQDVIATYAQARSMILADTEPGHILGDAAFQYQYLSDYIKRGVPKRALGGPVIATRAKFFGRKVRGEKTDTGVRTIDMISSAEADEDYQIMMLLNESQTTDPDEMIVPIPERIFVSPRGAKDREITAIKTGDAVTGYHIHRFPEGGSYLDRFIDQLKVVLDKYHLGLSQSLAGCKDKDSLITNVLDVKQVLCETFDDFNAEYSTEKNFFNGQVGNSKLQETDEAKRTTEAALTLYALHIATLKKILEEKDLTFSSGK